MTVTVRLPCGDKHRFPDPDAFVAWFRHTRPAGLLRVINTDSRTLRTVDTNTPQPTNPEGAA